MELASQQSLPCNQQQAWEALNDMDLLRQAIPGCESISPTGENQFELVVAAAVGPVKARFKSKLKLLDVVPPESYTMQFDGQGGAAGFGKGSAKVRLVEVDPTTTTLDYQVTAQVGGKIAQIGSRLVDMAAQKLANDFFTNFRKLLEARYPPPAAPDVASEASVELSADEQKDGGAQPEGRFARFVDKFRRHVV